MVAVIIRNFIKEFLVIQNIEFRNRANIFSLTDRAYRQARPYNRNYYITTLFLLGPQYIEPRFRGVCKLASMSNKIVGAVCESEAKIFVKILLFVNLCLVKNGLLLRA